MISRQITIEQYGDEQRVHIQLNCSESTTRKAKSGGEETDTRGFKQSRWVEYSVLSDFIQRFMNAETIREVAEL